MPTMVFINLPVADVARSTAFYEALGWTLNPMFSDENSSCIIVSDTIYVMLLTHEFFGSFIPGHAVADAHLAIGAQYALSCDSREDVDALVARAVDSGGSPLEPRDLGFMYSRAFQDPDGHFWDPFWMDPAAAAGGPPSE
jgi:predicted lactoylglutathione lyase